MTQEITVQRMETDDNLLCSLNLTKFSLKVYLIYAGTSRLKYFAFKDDKLLFSGNDFKPSPMHNIDDVESIVSLLSFLTTRPGDTDDEYFAAYTEEQMAYANSRECEELSGYVSDFDNSQEPTYQRKAKRYFKKHFTQG